MEKKPVVTCYGDQSLFCNLAGRVVQNLPKEAIDWKRSFGRPPKPVHVEAQFVFLEERFLESAVDLALTEQPFFHIFWVEVCELDRYKATVKDNISSWISILRKYNKEQEWMVVIVSGAGTQEAKTPNRKLNPLRTSIDDKIRSDFCPKHPERVTSLLDPSKHDRGSDQSWQIFMDRLRSQLMNAFNHHVSLFEEHMRTERERRTEASWNFMDYFLLQEELAFAYEMMGLYEDALIQYDELDALFSQFVLNAGAIGSGTDGGGGGGGGGNRSTVGLDWLAGFAAIEVSEWNGLCLSFPINQEKREMLKNRSATLVDFRNYVFSRQCSLLLLLCRPWEVAKRSLPFMHQTLNEVKILEVSLPDGAEACWVFLSCLEVLRTCERYSDSSEMENFSLQTANLWAYAREKLLHLGERLCGLMPDMEPSSDQLQLVVQLVSGMGHNTLLDAPGSPMAKLREALSSKNAFQKLYMEVSELAISTYKHIGRLRSARVIGRDLARFYMKLGEYRKAESFFLDLLRMYQASRWDRLTIAICKEMALCYQATGETHKYFKILTELAASNFCDLEMRKFYQKELTDCAHAMDSSLLNGSEDSSRPNSRPASISEPPLRPDSRLSDSPETRQEEEEERQTRVSFLPVFEAKTLSLSDGASSPVEARDSMPRLDLSPGEDLTVALRLISHLPQQLLPKSLALTVRKLPGVSGSAAIPNGGADVWPDDSSPNLFHFPPVLSSNPLATWEGEQLQMVSRLDLGHPGAQKKTIAAAYVACRNPAATLKKLDSVYQLMKNRNIPSEIDEDSVAIKIELNNPRIYPGSNLLYLKTTIPDHLTSGFYGFHRLCLTLEGAVEFVETIPDFAGIRFSLVQKPKEDITRIKLQLSPTTSTTTTTTTPSADDQLPLPAGQIASLRSTFLNLSDALASIKVRRKLSTLDAGPLINGGGIEVDDGERFGIASSLTVSVVSSKNCDVFTANGERNFAIEDISDPYGPVVKDLFIVGHHLLASTDSDSDRDYRVVFDCSWLEHPVERVIHFRPAFRVRRTGFVVENGDDDAEGGNRHRSTIVRLVLEVVDKEPSFRYRIRMSQLDLVQSCLETPSDRIFSETDASSDKANSMNGATCDGSNGATCDVTNGATCDDTHGVGSHVVNKLRTAILSLNDGADDVFVDCDTEAAFAWRISESIDEDSADTEAPVSMLRFSASADAVSADPKGDSQHLAAFGGLLSVPLIHLFSAPR